MRQLQAHPLSGGRLSETGRARAWIDGGARGNPGEAGFGVVFEIPGAGGQAETVEIAGYLGRTTNNVAEYAALVAALTYAARRGLTALTLHSDSELLVRQLEGRYKVKAPHLRGLYDRAQRLRRSIPRLAVRHVPRASNRQADRLANRAMDERLAPPEWLEGPWSTRSDHAPKLG